MRTSQPKISIVIPVYNQADCLDRALTSVQNQTYRNYEIIVVNDGSTDATSEVLASISQPELTVIDQDNRGVSAARNRGVESSTGELVAFLDADDEWLPEYLETIVSLYTRFDTCTAFATCYFLEESSKQQILPEIHHLPAGETHFVFTKYFESASVSWPPVWTSAVAVCRDAMLATGGFDTSLSSSEDLLAWALLYVQGDIAYCTTPLSIYHVDTFDQEDSIRVPSESDVAGDALIRILHDAQYPPDKKAGLRAYIAFINKVRATQFAHHDMRAAAFRSFMRTLRFNPFYWKVYPYVVFIFFPRTLRRQCMGLYNRLFSGHKARV